MMTDNPHTPGYFTEIESNDHIQKQEGVSSATHVPVINLKSIALACVARLLQGLDTTESGSHEAIFLKSYYDLFGDSASLQQQLHEYLKRPLREDQSIVILASSLALDDVEVLTIALALAVESDPMTGRALAYVQSPVGASRPTLGLLESALDGMAGSDGEQWIGGTLVSGMAVASGILSILNTQAPLPEQYVQLPTPLALALRNRKFLWPGCRQFKPESLVSLPESIHVEARRQADALVNQPNAVLVIRSASLREARSVAFEVCHHIGVAPLFSGTEPALLKGMGPLCLIEHRVPVFEYDIAPSETQQVAELAGYDGPRMVLIGPDGHVSCHSGSLLQWTVPVPARQEREVLWSHYLGKGKLSHQLAQDHVHSAARIMELSQLAKREARLQQRSKPQACDIRQAAWSAEESGLGSLAQAMTARIPDEALVLPDNTRQELVYLMQRCKSRESLDEELGISVKARYQMGVKALLVGPSGTGKTLVASWIATRLGLPLYRVDLASVVSKYIGETEKNLAQLLARAEQSEIVLLFDEADSLFGKRTDIKDSNDRHANSQTNYLLQRIEFYKGIVLLTSNSRGRFDSAFTRRLDKVIEFSLPAPQERRALWQSHLGDKHALSIKQLNQLAVSSDLAGGHIRNAVLTAAVQARAEKRQIVFDDIVIGLESEYRKLGRHLPAEIKRYQVRHV
jgi:hypothetical protein